MDVSPASALAFGAAATVWPLISYAQSLRWDEALQHNYDDLLKRTEALPSAQDEDAFAIAYDLIFMSHTLHINPRTSYAHLQPRKKHSWEEWIRLRFPNATTTSVSAAWPAGVAGLFAGVAATTMWSLLVNNSHSDPFLHECVVQFKTALINYHHRDENADTQNLLIGLRFAAVQLAWYALAVQLDPQEKDIVCANMKQVANTSDMAQLVSNFEESLPWVPDT